MAWFAKRSCTCAWPSRGGHDDPLDVSMAAVAASARLPAAVRRGDAVDLRRGIEPRRDQPGRRWFRLARAAMAGSFRRLEAPSGGRRWPADSAGWSHSDAGATARVGIYQAETAGRVIRVDGVFLAAGDFAHADPVRALVPIPAATPCLKSGVCLNGITRS